MLFLISIQQFVFYNIKYYDNRNNKKFHKQEYHKKKHLEVKKMQKANYYQDPFVLIAKQEQECLDNIVHFFRLLKIDLHWDNYTKYVDSYQLKRFKKHYFEYENDFILFSNDEKVYKYYEKRENNNNNNNNNNNDNNNNQNENSNQMNVENVYDDRLYAIAALAFDYIVQLAKKIDGIRPEQRQLNMPIVFDIITKSNFYMKAFGSNKVYKINEEYKNWKQWKVYWSTPQHDSSCYSYCSGSCTSLCKGATCIYIFPSSERNYEGLPDNEKVDPRNVFDDDLYWLAARFHDMVSNTVQRQLYF